MGGLWYTVSCHGVVLLPELHDANEEKAANELMKEGKLEEDVKAA